MVAVHPLAFTPAGEPHMGAEPLWDLSLFGGQGSATIGPPIFMHRASSPGPTVPRKHHKGENPHETFPVIGASLRYATTALEASVFSAGHLGPGRTAASTRTRARPIRSRRACGTCSRARSSCRFSGERPARSRRAQHLAGQRQRVRVGDAPRRAHRRAARLGDGPPRHRSLRAECAREVAVRSPDRRGIYWLRTEVNERFEPLGAPVLLSGPWLFQLLGFEHVAFVSPASGLQLGLFAEATYTHIPSELSAGYGRSHAVALSAGLHLFGMWMLDGNLRRLNHHHH